MFKDLTMIVCSYNTPFVTLTMLKSFINCHGKGPHNIIIMENSTDDATEQLLNENYIPYIRNNGLTHSLAVDKALRKCHTKYALLADTDILFKVNIEKLITTMKQHKFALLGSVSANRGGYNLKPRVDPWFCLIDVEQIQQHGICFHNQRLIDQTLSQGFYNNIPYQQNDPSKIFYDVGSTFYEEVSQKGLKVANAKGIDKYFTHFEGMSWRRETKNPLYVKMADDVTLQHTNESKDIQDIDVKNQYETGEDKRKPILYVQPIFCPSDKMTKINCWSIKSFFRYIEENPYPVDVVFEGYCRKDEYWEQISSMIENESKRIDINVQYARHDKNRGKACIVNNIVTDRVDKYDYLLTCDSDIIFEYTTPHIFQRLLKIATTSETALKHPFGMVALNQTENNCHWVHQFNMKANVGAETLQWCHNGCGIAGGSIFVNLEAWKKVGGYRTMGVYSGDDGYLLRDIQLAGYTATVATTISIIHPESALDQSYVDWKAEQMKKCKGTIIDESEINNISEETECLWKKIDQPKEKEKPTGHKNARVLTMCSSRNRPARLKTMIDSWRDTKSEGTKMCVYISNDDPKLEEYQMLMDEYIDKDVEVEVGERKFMPAVLNYFSTEKYPNLPYYNEVNDDHVFRTSQWDQKLIDAIEKHNNGWSVAYGKTRNLPSAVMMAGKLLRAQEYFFSPVFKHTYVDNQLQTLGRELNLLIHVPEVNIEHMHPAWDTANDDENYKWVNAQIREGQQQYSKWVNEFKDNDVVRIRKAMEVERES